jgi:hypothetical protein
MKIRSRSSTQFCRTLGRRKKSHSKIGSTSMLPHAWKDLGRLKGACDQALRHDLEYLWVDTNCIDKTSSAELSEAINSMFAWYRNATICYAYLADIPPLRDQCSSSEIQHHLSKSRWFGRGWTLQELLAPTRLIFYAQDWTRIGSRATLADALFSITQIEKTYLTGERPLTYASVGKRMSWLSQRVTTRTEDMACCMLGIFEINMPLLYGEGSKAFVRLQEEIIKVSNDHTIFCWTWIESVPSDWVSMLAPCAEAFRHSGNFIQSQSNLATTKYYSITNAGLSITLPVIQTWSYYLAMLNAKHETGYDGMHACIPIRGFLDLENREENDVMERIAFPPAPIFASPFWILCRPSIFIRSRPNSMSQMHPNTICSSPSIPTSFKYGFLLVMDSTKKFLDHTLQSSKAVRSKAARSKEKVFFLERTRDLIGIETYPSGLFDVSRSLVVLPEDRQLASGVLIRLGLMENSGCVLFLGLVDRERGSSARGQRLLHCRILSSTTWGPRGNDSKRRLIYQALKTELENLVSDHTMSVGIYSAMVSDEVMLDGIGNISLTYITAEASRLKVMGIGDVDDDDIGDIDACSNVPGVRAWTLRKEAMMNQRPIFREDGGSG